MHDAIIYIEPASGMSLQNQIRQKLVDGILIAVMPNDTAYYYFSDGNEFRYLDAVREVHRIRPMCEADRAD